MIIGFVALGVCDISDVELGPHIEPSPNSTSLYAQKLYDVSTPSVGKTVLGAFLIIFAEILCAFKVVFEEKFVEEYNVPVWQAVALEGTFGIFTLTILSIAFFLIRVFIPLGNFDFAGISTGYLY